MISDEQGKVLHDKASRGRQQSEVEQQQLEEWYAHQDRLELEAIQLPANHTEISDLQARIMTALDELAKLTKRIKEVAAKNEQLRKENAVLLKKVN